MFTPQPAPQPILLQLLSRTRRDTIQPRHHLRDGDACSSSGAFTRIVNRVPGARVISASTLFLNAAIASTAAYLKERCLSRAPFTVQLSAGNTFCRP
jgi:hypothetical protein